MRVIGLMSGTSMDGLDAAVAQFELDGGAVAMSPLRHIERPWPDRARTRLHAALGPTTAGELCELDQLIGQESAELAAQLLPADLVVSHGQTVHHWVQDGAAKGTLQLGQPAWIVQATGLPVISDVRPRDIAAGGHGAPLAGILDDLWLRGRHTRAALNLGGIANVTIVRRGRPHSHSTPARPIACSTRRRVARPAGAATRTAGSRPAARRTRHCCDACSTTPITRSCRRNRPAANTSASRASAIWGSRARATAGDADGADRNHRRRRACAVRARRGRHPGGGVRNPALLAALKRRLPLTVSDEHGLPAQAKEAYLMALIGFLVWHQVPLLTGPHVLGRISPGDAPLALPPPAAPPTGLVIRTSSGTLDAC